MLKIGNKAPSFTGIDQNGNQINSTDYLGKKIIIFFYPKANTPGCTTEACNLRDHEKILQEKGYQLIGISADTIKIQSNFSKKYNLNFPLIADPEKKIIDAFGVWGRKKFMGREFDGILRTTFIINEKGFIEKIIEKVKTKDHARQILES